MASLPATSPRKRDSQHGSRLRHPYCVLVSFPTHAKLKSDSHWESPILKGKIY